MFEQELQVKYSYACGAGHCIYVHGLNMCTLYGIRSYICREYIHTFCIIIYKFPVAASES